MTFTNPTPSDDGRDRGRDARMDAAITASRAHTDARWVEICDRIRTRALQTTRTSPPVAAYAPSGPVHVSTQVLITYVRDALAGVRGSRVDDITVATAADNTYTGLIIYISARYGEPLLPIADTLRERATERLRELLGPSTPPVTVTTMEVHIDDVHQD